MGFIGVQPASVPLTASDITDGIVSNAKLGADSVNATKIADDSISDEHIDITAITGHSAITSLADTDKFLVSDASDSNNLKYVEKQYLGGGGSLEFLARTYVSSPTSTVEFTGLNNTGGGSIRVVFQRIITDTSGGVNVQFVVGDNSSYRTSSSTYQSAHNYARLDSSSDGSEQAIQSSVRLCDSIGSDSSGTIGGYIDIFGFADSTTNKFAVFNLSHLRAAGGRYNKVGGVFMDTDAAMTKLKFQLSSGNYTSGEFIIYRFKES